MADNFNDPFAQNLIGLWDFLSSDPKGDTGLADGIAQDGSLGGGASISGGRLHTDGHGDYFDVDGNYGPNDVPFDLSEGTIAVQFTQGYHKGTSPDTLVNRGEYLDKHSDGWFGIQVTLHGAVTVQHVSNGQNVTLTTNNHFFSPGDTVKATYAWSQDDGLTFTVQNLTKGTEQTLTSSKTGLTMDIGDNDDEIFTFAAREVNDGLYDEEFKGAIDYVAVYNTDILNTPPVVPADGAVDGEDFGEVMGLGYDDSNAPTDQGGDIITQDADLIFGNGGDDTIDGAGGNDTIYGDGGNGMAVSGRESFNWSPVSEHQIDYGVVQNTGSVNVTYERITDTGTHESFKDYDLLNVSGIDGGGETVDNDRGMRSETNGKGNDGDFQWTFSEPVGDVEFNINDIDGDGLVTVRAYDADNNEIPVGIVGGSHLTVNGNVIDSNGGYANTNSTAYNAQITIEGPVSRIVVEHDQNGYNNSGVTITDMYFDVFDDTGSDVTPADDVIMGGAGDDVIYGDNGEDLTATPPSTGIIDVEEVPGADHSFIVWEISDATYVNAGWNGDPFRSDSVGEYYINGSKFMLNPNSVPTTVGIRDNDSRFEDGDNGQQLVQGVTLNGRTVQAGEELEIEYSYSVKDTSGNIINIYAVEEDSDQVVGFISDRPLVLGEEYTFVARTSTDPEISYDKIATSYMDPNAPIDPGSDGTNGAGGDDVITGGEGADTMFGEGGNDTFLVGSASDGAGDVIVGGNGPDDTTDNDVLDLRGAGDVVIDDMADSTDAGARKGTVTFEDGSTLAFSQIETILVDPTNDAPVANDDEITVDEDDSVTFDPTANDVDPDGDPVTVDSFTQPDNGTVTQNPDGTLTYTPDPNYNGPDSFEVTVTDPDGLTSTSTVNVTVDPVNDAPVANDDPITVDEDDSVTFDPTANDVDPDGDPVTVDSFTQPDNGTVTQNPDGTLTYTPDPNYNGPDSFEVTVTDPDGLTSTSTVNVTVDPVNDAPVANDDPITVDEDDSVTFDPTANDVDPDGDPVTVDSFTQPDNGTVTQNPDGTLTYTPDPNYNGPDSFEVTVTDPDGLTSTSTVNVTVDPVNDAPDAVNDAITTDEEVPVTIDVLANDTDVDGDDLTITAASVPTEQGTVEIVDNKLVYTPATDFNGEATISYAIEDGNGGTDVAEVAVTVNNVNDAPVAADDLAETDEDTPVTIDVLANDTDVDGDPLTVTSASVPADQGTVEIVDNKVVFTPALNFNGPATITYTVDDGQGGTDEGTATVNVGAVNDGPTAVDDAITTDEDTPITIDALANDTDPDNAVDELSITGASVPAAQGTVEIVDNKLVFSPAENFNGEATISYSIADPDGGTSSAEVVVTVTPVNDDPVAVDDIENTDEDVAVVVDLLGNDSDVDGDDLTLASVSVDPAQGSVVDNGDGTVTFTPAPDYNGPATITYTVSDGNGGTDEGEATVNVGAVNDAPVAEDDTETTLEDTPVTIDVLANDSDPDGDDLSVISATVPADQGTVEVVDNKVVFTPAQDFNGDATITYTISDGNGLTDTAEVAVTVTPDGDAPVTVDDVAETDEDTPVIIDPLANDSDPDGDPLDFAGTPTSPNGTVEINPDGTITFTPDPDFNGPTTIDYIAVDPDGNETPGTITVDVTPVNDDPVAVDDAETTPFNTAVTIDALANDTDVDNDPLTISAATVPAAQGTVAIVANQLVFTPADGFEGTATITYTVSDGQGGSDEGEVTVTVEDQPLDGIVSNGDEGALIDENYIGDPEGDMVDNNDEILPGEGPNDDIIQAGGGNDTVRAGEGNDDVFAGTGDDSVEGNAGDDILRGEEGEDTLRGGAGDDTIDGGADDDVIFGGDGSDSILGGDGNDSIISSDPDNDLKPDAGYPGLFPGEEGTPAAEDERDFVDGGAGNDTISTGDDRDTIFGGTGDDVIDGGIDDDEISGDEGNDRIVGGEGSDLISGGDGDDTIYAGNDPDLGLDALNIEDDGSNPFGPDLRPDNGRDTVDGGDGNDLIFGADDDDVLMGGAGNDTIDGGIDDDLIDGGTGDDSLLGGQGKDTINGGEGNDFINAGRNADVVDGGDGNDTIFGENGADILRGGEGDDVIDGGTGDDSLYGEGGNDYLIGATGDDNIDGGDGRDTIDGGNGGSDVMFGGADEDLFINVNAGEVVDGGEEVTDGVDFDTLDLRGSAPGGGSLNVVYDASNPENGVVNYFDSTGAAAGSLTFSNIENVIPCFTPGTRIATAQGERRVEDLMVGDRVITRDNGIQEIRWIGKRLMTGEELAAADHLRPVLIRQGALGKGLPERDMLVSPQHRVLMSSDKTALYFDESEVLVAAKHLTGMEGIDVVEVSETTYIHVMFDQHEVILSDGAWTESFQPGDQTLASMGDAQRAEILELFPELETVEGIEAYSAARRSLKKHEAKLLS